MSDLSLYIHIPFCVRKCNYCDFLSAPCDDGTKQEYVEALCQEIKVRAEEYKEKIVDTIFFGGGTPSILSGEQMTKIMAVIRSSFQILTDAEISMEMNPGTVDRQKLETYKELGINRLSIGLQSANNEELKILGRIHTWEEFLQTWELVREVGFTNVNIDLMSALPGQTLESYRQTVEKVLALKPEHISAYSLIVEEGTPFFDWFDEEANGVDSFVKEVPDYVKAKALPDENADRSMYELTKKLLEEQGYYRYEISNYALKGYECKHNIGYWKRKEYLGLGLGAASLLSNVRYSNISDLHTYLEVQKWIEEQIELSIADQMEEFMFLGLRMMEGVSALDFEEQFGISMQEVYGVQMNLLIKQGLIAYNETTDRISLTTEGIDVSNRVFVEFMHE